MRLETITSSSAYEKNVSFKKHALVHDIRIIQNLDPAEFYVYNLM